MPTVSYFDFLFHCLTFSFLLKSFTHLMEQPMIPSFLIFPEATCHHRRPNHRDSLNYCNNLSLFSLPIPQYVLQLMEGLLKKVNWIPWMLYAKPLQWLPSVLYSSFAWSLSPYTSLLLSNSLRSFSYSLAAFKLHTLLSCCSISFAHILSHLWKRLPSKLLRLRPTHCSGLYIIIFPWYTLLFSLWDFYAEHLAQPVINDFYVCFILSDFPDRRICEGRAEALFLH